MVYFKHYRRGCSFVHITVLRASIPKPPPGWLPFQTGNQTATPCCRIQTFAALDFRNSKKSELCPRQVQWFDYGFKIQNIIKTFRRTARKSVTSYSSEVPVQASIRQKTIRDCLITYLKCNKSWNKA